MFDRLEVDTPMCPKSLEFAIVGLFFRREANMWAVLITRESINRFGIDWRRRAINGRPQDLPNKSESACYVWGARPLSMSFSSCLRIPLPNARRLPCVVMLFRHFNKLGRIKSLTQ